MPVRNAAPFLDDCLNSILQQNYTHWELIAVDDHSTDESWEVLNTFSEKDERITLFKNEGKGIIAALNLAFNNAKGELITRMDADDRMSPNKLDLFVQKLDQSGLGHLAVGLVEYFSKTALGDGYVKYAQWLNTLTLGQSNFEEIYRECVIPSPNWMLHKEDLIACGAFHPEIYPEDYDLCFRMRRQNFKIVSISEVTHYWRDHQARSSRNDPNYLDNRFIDLKCQYFATDDFDEASTVIIWGAGKKGKLIASQFQKLNIPFRWMSNNEKKIGKEISGIIIENEDILQTIENPQLIISIAAKDAQSHIQETINSLTCRPYFFT